jgi:branched-chain amino acid transport system ATP-binding protein
MLELDGVNSSYGDSHVLFDIALHVGRGEILALLGRNGAGKTTTLRTIMGVVPPHAGTITLGGTPIAGLPPHRIAALGLQLVPEERAIFGTLTVEENLKLAALTAPKAWSLAKIYDVFPRLQERRKSGGKSLSGGEQQMLAMARALMGRPKLILMDEPTMGLSPLWVDRVLELIATINKQGTTIFMVEQNANLALQIAHDAYVLQTGRIVLEGPAAKLRADPRIRDAYLGGAIAA